MSTPAPGSTPPVDLDDALAVLRYGEDVLDGDLEARMAAAADHAAAAALVARLEQLRRALQAHDPRSTRRGIGLVGRLLGRDVLAEAEAGELRARLGTLVAAAQRSADALETRTALHRRLQDEARGTIAAIDAAVVRARSWLAAHPDAAPGSGSDAMGLPGPRANLARRLEQLATVQASRELALGQLALLQAQELELLARWQRIRDVLLPAWRQQALAEAGRSGRGHAEAAAKTWAAIAAEVEAMAGKLE